MDTQLSTFPHRLELDRAPVAEGRVPATAIVKRQVVEHIQPCLIAGRIATPVHAFDFERVEETLNTGIVPATPLAAHAHDDAMLLQQTLMIEGAVLAAAIRVMEHPGFGLRRHSAMVSASSTRSRVLRSLRLQSTIIRNSVTWPRRSSHNSGDHGPQLNTDGVYY